MLRKNLANFLVLIVRFYQTCLSPFFFAPCCRFYPSCSEYAIEAIKTHGPAKGSFMGIKRILRCHPLNPGGYDPVK
ncbi:MAG TPA: membrane protein insertion efficiency factor YidD [Smithella sp.]|nr:membrane protein insertion efficiency factor YidD [Smithella sp.]